MYLSKTKIAKIFVRLRRVEILMQLASSRIDEINERIKRVHMSHRGDNRDQMGRRLLPSSSLNCPIITNHNLNDPDFYPLPLDSSYVINLNSFTRRITNPSFSETDYNSFLSIFIEGGNPRMLAGMVSRSKFSNLVLFKSSMLKDRRITKFKDPKDSSLGSFIDSRLSDITKLFYDLNELLIKDRPDISRSVIGFRKGRSYVQHAKVHLGCKSLVTMDIVKFYNSISLFAMTENDLFGQILLGSCEDIVGEKISKDSFENPHVFKAFESYRRFVALSFLYNMSYLTYHGILPTGMSYSPSISNVMLNNVDRRILAHIDETGMDYRYTRYADDLCISSAAGVKDDGVYNITIDFVKIIEKIVLDNGFYLNYDKTNISGVKDKKVVSGIYLDHSGTTPQMSIGREKKKQLFKRYCGKDWADLTSQDLGLINWVKTVNPAQHKSILRKVSGIPEGIVVV